MRLEQGLDAFVVIDGLPVVPQESKQKLVKYLLKKLNTVGKTKEDAIFMPINDQNNMSEGYEQSRSIVESRLTIKAMRSWNMRRQNRQSLRPKP